MNAGIIWFKMVQLKKKDQASQTQAVESERKGADCFKMCWRQMFCKR